MNVDPLNPDNAPSPSALLAVGCRWVRVVSRPGVEPYVADCQSAGIMVLAVITEQSQGYICSADQYQIGNRPDPKGKDLPYTPGSDYMGAVAYVGYWRLYYRTLRDQGVTAPIIGAGLESGQPDYWQAVQAAGGLEGAAGFSVHPYAKNTSQAKSLLQAYQRITPGLPLWCTEINCSAAEMPGFAAMLKLLPVVLWAHFCWSPSVARDQGVYVLDDTMKRILGTL